MKKVLLFLMLFAAMLTASLQAQTTVEIGTGTSTTYVTPFNSLWGYSFVEQIYTATEVTTAGTITSVSFYHKPSSSTTDQTNNITLYMKNVSRSTFSSSTDYEQVSQADIVYSGTWTIPGTEGWTTITLDQPFYYDGSSNLMIAMHEFSSGYSTRYFAYTSTTNAVITHHSDSADPDPYNLGSYSGNKYTSANRANIQLEIVTAPISCPAPTALVVEEVDEQSAFVSWSPGGTETSWDIYLTNSQSIIPDSNTTPTDVATDTFYNAVSLNSQTTYYLWVRANCGVGDVSRWKSVSFMTSQVPAYLPYTCDFEDVTENGEWTIENGSQTNKWYIGTALNNTPSGSNSLYISNDNGVTNAYSNTISHVYAYRDVDFTQGAAAYQLDFDWRNKGESANYDVLKVYVGNPVAVTPGSTMPAGANAQLLGSFYGKDTWQHATINLPSTISGTHRLYFYWYNDSSGGSNPPAAVDNISIIEMTCGFPTSLVVDTITSTSVTVHWHPATTSDNAWQVAVAPAGTSIDSVTFESVYDTIFTAQNLNSNTNYVLYVRTDCGGGDVSSAVSTTFRTDCADYTSLPITENFEDYGGSSYPTCWTKISSYSTYPYTYTSAAHGGTYGLYFFATTSSSGTYCYAVLPAIDPAVTLTDLTVRFDMKRTNNYVKATLGLISDPTDLTTFTAIQTPDLTTSWEEFEIPLNNVTANGRHLAFKCELDTTTTGTSGYVYMDNLLVDYTPSCPRIQAILIDENNILSDGATITWMPGPTGSSWDVQVQLADTAASDNDWVTVNDTFYTVQGLTPNTRYTVYVRTNCGSEVSEARSLNFRTACGTETIPFTEDFESYGSSSFPTCWTKISSYSTYPYTYSSAAYGGSSYGLYFFQTTYSNGTYSYAVAPAIDPSVTLTDLTVRFNMKRTNANVDAILGLMTTPTDTATFTPIQTIQLSTDWEEYLVPLTNVTANGSYIAIKGVLNGAGTSGYIYLDNFSVIYTPSCIKPSNLVSTGNTSTSVSLAWHEDGSATAWNVAYGLAGFNPDSTEANIELVNDTVVTIDNLLAGVMYDFYVQANCGGGVSEWRGPLTAAPGQYIMGTSGWDTLYTCGAAIYDDGGANGNYSASCDAYLVIYPDEPGSFVEISGTILAESYSWDYLIIYDGVGTNNQILKTSQSSNTLYTIPSIISTTGPLTIYFHSDGSGQYAGFALTTSCVSCVSPTLTAPMVGVDNVTLSWSSFGGSQTSFEVAYGPAGINPDSVTAEIVNNATSLVLTGLDANTSYDAYIRTLCDDATYAPWSSVLHFTTLAGLPAEVPYTCDFEDADENSAWVILNGTQTNKWFVGSAANNTVTGDSALYVSNDNGVSNAYTISTASTVWAYRDINFSSALEHTLSFDWRGYGEGSSDYLRVYIGDPSIAVTAGSTTISGATILFNTLNKDTLWKTATYTLDATYTGTTKRLFFMWRNDSSTGTQPPAAVDNITIEGVDCVKPNNVQVSNITSNSAMVTWSPASSADSQWELEYGDFGFTQGTGTVVSVNDSSYLLTNLTDATRYEVYLRTNCGNNEYSEWTSSYVFTTLCDAITTLPYTENFDSITDVSTGVAAPTTYPNHELPMCWNFMNMSSTTSTYPQVFVSSSSAYVVSGNCLFMKSSLQTPLYAALPSFTEDIHNLQISFTYRNEGVSSSNGILSLGYMTDPSNPSTFVELYACPQTTTLTEVIQDLSSIPSDVTAVTIAFKYTGAANNFYVSIDNVMVEVIPTCPKPTGLTVEETTSSTVTLSWTEAGSAIAWEIEYGPRGFTQGTGTIVPVATNPYTISGLAIGTTYDFYVRASCGSGDESIWVGPVATTPGSYNMPVTGEETVSMCGGVIYDNGGINGDYSTNCNATVVVNPESAGLMVHLTGTYDIETGSTSRWDYLQIFDGNTTSGTVLFDSHTDNSGTLDVVSTTGPLTLFFHSDGSVVHSGFELQVSCDSAQTPPEPCDAPTNVAVSNVTYNSADVDWAQEGTPDSWTVSYKKGSVSTWTTVTTTTHPYTITNLEPETSYTVFVTANCGEETSDASAQVSFVTGVGVNDYVLDNTVVYPNPTTGEFRIENSELRIDNVEVYDVYGKLIKTVKVDDNGVNIDLSGNASGIYFTRIYTDKGMITKRIVKK